MKKISYVFLLLYCLVTVSSTAIAADAPKPDSLDAKYGKYDLNTYDFWKAKSD